MKSRNQSSLLNLCIILMLIAAPLQLLYTKSTSASNAPVYTLGVIPQFKMHRMQSIWLPVTRELKKITGLNIKLVIPNSIPEFEGRLLSGEFDFAYTNPYEIILANKSAGYEPIAFDKNRKLQGIIVASKNSDINSITQLNKKDVAFPSYNALGASLLIRAELKDKHNIQVNSRYLRSHDDVYLSVVQGRMSAGGGVIKTLEKQPPLLKNKLKIIYRTQSVAAHPFAAHPRINENIRQRFYQALHTMSQSPHELEKLRRIPVSNISPAKLQDYKPLADLQLHRFYEK